MIPEEFLNKWLPVVEHTLKVTGKTMFTNDLEALIKYFNDEAGRCIIEEKIGHIDNWGEEMIRRSNSPDKKSLWGLPPFDPELSKVYPLYTPDEPDSGSQRAKWEEIKAKLGNPFDEPISDKNTACCLPSCLSGNHLAPLTAK